ncbi:MAG: T9SS type A sorting domain-containing protein [Candidatus Electryonea clarkiae]|nr:T9SS type A sorting domain-containing protein [Candidatus Electryonea clarkiae]MDP8285324.1 T9SS type A sorting domain-containing protein [Candidatus Electryonea clarkiae]
MSNIALAETYNFEQFSEILFCDGAYGIETQDDFVFLSGKNGITIIDISDPPNFEVIRNLHFSNIHAISIENDILVMGIRNDGVRLFNISEPDSFTALSTITGDDPAAILLDDGYLYMIMDHSFWIYDISNPEDPEFVSLIDRMWSNRFDKQGDLLTLADGDGLIILDVSDPSDPQIYANLSTEREELRYFCANLSGNHLYTGGFGGMRIYDIEDPGEPLFLGQHYFDGYTFNLLVIENTAYLVHQWELEVVDITDPENTERIGWIHPPYLNEDLAVYDDYIMLSDGIEGMILLDISDPENIIETGRPQPIGYGGNVILHNDYIYLHNTEKKLYTFDISNPNQPEIVNDLDINHDASFMWENRGALYIIYTWLSGGWSRSYTSLVTYDLSDPAAPSEVDRVVMNHKTRDAYLVDDKIFLITGRNVAYTTYEDQLTIIDISEPLEPNNISTTELELSSAKVAVTNSTLIISATDTARSPLALYIYDITDPEDVVLENIFEFDSTVVNRDLFLGDMAIFGEYVYISAFDSTIGIFQLEDNELSFRGIMELDYYAGKLIADRNYLFTKGGKVYFNRGYSSAVSKSIHVYDLTNPQNPVETGQYDNQVSITDISQADNLLTCTDGFSLKLFDICGTMAVKSSPDVPLPSGFYLGQFYPNPFNPRSIISLGLPSDAEINVSVYNIIGQKVTQLATGRYNAGNHEIVFDGSEFSSGIYFIHASVPGKMDEVRKVVLVR